MPTKPVRYTSFGQLCIDRIHMKYRKCDKICNYLTPRSRGMDAASLKAAYATIDTGLRRTIEYNGFTPIARLGSGAFATVYKAQSMRKEGNPKYGTYVAIKCILKSRLRKEKREREIEVMKRMNHQNIVQFLDSFSDDRYFCLVLQYINGGELFHKICDRGTYDEHEAIPIIRQILEAINYMHQKGVDVAHRDLKPENLLCEEDEWGRLHIFIADFGLSNLIPPDVQLETLCGSPEYVAPEVLDGKGYSPKVDEWAVGVITYVLLTGYLPFYSKDKIRLRDLILYCVWDWEDCPALSIHARNFVECLMIRDPKQRMSAAEALRHPWLKRTEREKHEFNLTTFQQQMGKYNIWRSSERSSDFGLTPSEEFSDDLGDSEIEYLATV